MIQHLRRLDKSFMLLVVVGTAMAVLIRISLLPFRSGDFLGYGRQWYYEIQSLGFRAFRHEFSNYNPPYLYLLYLIARFVPRAPSLVAVKLPSLVADFLCAVFVYRIVLLRRGSRREALLAYMALLLAPTVILNGSFWGQVDSVYAAGLLASLYGVLTRRPWLATAGFGVALAFKLQAAFYFPFLLAVSLRKELPWKSWALVPTILVLALAPAGLVGRPLASLAAVYFNQAQQYTALTAYAPTLYAWLPSPPELFDLFVRAGLALALTVAAIFVWLIKESKAPLTAELMVQLSALCVMLVPFFTPKMHERYFFAADIFSIVFAFYFLSDFHIAVIVNLSSAFSYIAALFAAEYHVEPVPQTWLALAMLFAVLAMARRSRMQLYPDLSRTPESRQSHPPAEIG